MLSAWHGNYINTCICWKHNCKIALFALATFVTHRSAEIVNRTARKLCRFPFVHFQILINKANLRDLIAATGLAISNWIQIVNFSARVTVKFDGWPCKTIGQLFYATSSFVHHFVPIGEFKLKLQSGNAQSGSNWMIFRAVWPWNLTDDLAIQ